MALVDTSNAIGAVSRALKGRLDTISGIHVTIGPPSEATGSYPILNLFLYEVTFDPHLKNTSLNEGEKPPLWMVLKYLLTAFHSDKDSDSDLAHDHLGAALRAVYTDDLLRLDTLAATDQQALASNPSPLHVTFDEAPADLLAKLMQGPDDKIRLSACFQVRPVMIAASEPGNFSLLVGIDYTAPQPPPITLADPYRQIDVIPSMGPRIESISPTGFEVGEVVGLRGTDLHLANLSVTLGPAELPVVMQQPDELRFKVDDAIIAASSISAGSHPVHVVQTLTGTGKKRKSNALVGNLVPTLNTLTFVDVLNPVKQREFKLTGNLLGVDADDTILAFYRDGSVFRMFDHFTKITVPTPGQTSRQLVLTSNDGVPAGQQRIILIVNGQQALNSPQFTLPPWP